MAITINHTGKHKLRRENYEITLLYNAEGLPYFTFSLNLTKGLVVSDDSRIIVEASTGNTMQRFNFGTVSRLSPPPSTILDQLSVSATPTFRVLFVDESPADDSVSTNLKGRITALADRAQANTGDEDEGGTSLLVIRCVDLGEMIWNVKMNPGDRPELCLNNRLPDAKHILTSRSEYQGLIIPAAFRQVIASYRAMDTYDDNDDATQQYWWQLAEILGGPLNPDADFDEFANWLDGVIEEFCKQHSFAGNMIEALRAEEAA